MRTRSGTCTLNGRIVSGSGFAGTCACPSAIDGNKSNAASRNLPHCEPVLSALSNSVFMAPSHSSVYRTDEEKLGHDIRIPLNAASEIRAVAREQFRHAI